MDYTKLFYWLAVADNARVFFGWAVGIFMIALVVCIIAKIAINTSTSYYGDDGIIEKAGDNKVTNKYMFRIVPFTVLFWFLLVLTPTKRDALFIVAGGQTLNYLSSDSTAQQIPAEALNLVVTELRKMGKEASVELDITTTKERVLEDAKKLSTEDLLKKMAEDVNFKELILENIK